MSPFPSPAGIHSALPSVGKKENKEKKEGISAGATEGVFVVVEELLTVWPA